MSVADWTDELAEIESARRPGSPTKAVSSALWRQPGRRTIVLPVDEWRVGSRLSRAHEREHYRRLRARDYGVLSLVDQHRYLATDQLAALLFPSERMAQERLRQLAEELRLLQRWKRLRPLPGGLLRKMPMLWLLTDRGAAVLARERSLDAEETKALIRRSGAVDRYLWHLDHDLQVNDFFCDLVRATKRELHCGLLRWVGEDRLRAQLRLHDTDLAPDSWGLYLTPDRGVVFHLEVDRGSEGEGHLRRKRRMYEGTYAHRPGGEYRHVLWLVRTGEREQQLHRVLGGSEGARHWTATERRLTAAGPLGQVWREVGGAGEGVLLALPDLEARPRSDGQDAADCLGKPGCEDRRPL